MNNMRERAAGSWRASPFGLGKDLGGGAIRLRSGASAGDPVETLTRTGIGCRLLRRNSICCPAGSFWRSVGMLDSNLHRSCLHFAEWRGECDFGGVAADADSDQAIEVRLPRRVEQPPSTVEISLEDRVEIGRLKTVGITADEASRYIQRATEGNTDMGEVAADPARFNRLSSAVVCSSDDPR